ncbi:hypothetical protein Mgra_00010093 [Meloidogyne graminicola]|uniref:Uncharacterized protein n=1 Tax=Meloidogyne graminicola TaxID=189291 RepID=A0A8S9Z652_9BILA|nr:hypothetical protein Mgra_00010093 [Meloidogyne graminicola]
MCAPDDVPGSTVQDLALVWFMFFFGLRGFFGWGVSFRCTNCCRCCCQGKEEFDWSSTMDDLQRHGLVNLSGLFQ